MAEWNIGYSELQEMDATTVQRLMLACLRRKKWEADLVATATIGYLGMALGGGKESNGKSKAKPKAKIVEKISGGEMLKMMGVQL